MHRIDRRMRKQRKQRMQRRTAAALIVGVLGTFGIAGAAGALPNGNDSKGTVGGCIDNFYGNATNEATGHPGIIPSQSPGPWVNNPSDPDNPTPGPSVGDVHKFLRGAVPGITGKEVNQIICTFP